MKLIGINLMSAVINLMIFQSFIIQCYGKDSYSKDVPNAKTDKRKFSTFIFIFQFVISFFFLH